MIRLFAALVCAAQLVAAEVAAQSEYVLWPGDLLSIKVYGHDDLTLTLRVPTSGALRFPLIGALASVTGRTVEDVTDEVQRRLADGFLRDPTVSISIAEFGHRSVSVVGSVSKPGDFLIDPLVPTTALQAIGKSGGFLDNANRQSAVVVRAGGEPQAPIPIPRLDAPDAAKRDVVLRPGDVIIVPALDRAYVIGMVQKPGPVLIPANEPLTVSKAISLTGGFDKFARQSKVQLIRGGTRVAEVDVRGLLDGDARVVDPPILPGDTVFVPESRL